MCALPLTLQTGGSVLQTDASITVLFDDTRYSISTSHLNGGLHHTLAVRNQKLIYTIEKEQDLPGGSVARYLSLEFEALDIPINFSTALLTAADMVDAGYSCVTQGDTTVEVIVTAGFAKTACRPGDGYYYEEKAGDFHVPGTINLLVFTNKALTDGAMTRALLTITEAKTVALQEEGVRCIRSGKLATGTSTDGIIFTIDPTGDLITDSGSFSLFGDTLAKAVIYALRAVMPVAD